MFDFSSSEEEEERKEKTLLLQSRRLSELLFVFGSSLPLAKASLTAFSSPHLPLPFHHHSSTMREVISLHIGQAGTCGVSRKGGGAREKRREKNRKMQVKAMRAATREEALGLLSFLSSFGVAASCPSSVSLASFSASQPGAWSLARVRVDSEEKETSEGTGRATRKRRPMKEKSTLLFSVVFFFFGVGQRRHGVESKFSCAPFSSASHLAKLSFLRAGL